MFKEGEADKSSLVPVFGRRSFVDDICFGNETFEGVPNGIQADVKNTNLVAVLTFPKTKKVYAAAIYQVKDEAFGGEGN
ncbi:hypothetical protein PHMEG_00020767 [Phytophthora megakarya]|uniref:Uncharacterized protein n=1 Tax=Phytophthora megakarya TaxID=4795 RepID=A0A225VPT5_9STRA|nr:hypothetical protein PHMEG_00020767 [Phytophthora megakarya]